MPIATSDTQQASAESSGVKRKAPPADISPEQTRNVRPKREQSDVEQQFLKFQLKTLAYIPVDTDLFHDTAKSVHSLWNGVLTDLSKAMEDNGAPAATIAAAEAIFDTVVHEGKILQYMKRVAPKLRSGNDVTRAVVCLLEAVKESSDFLSPENIVELRKGIDACLDKDAFGVSTGPDSEKRMPFRKEEDTPVQYGNCSTPGESHSEVPGEEQNAIPQARTEYTEQANQNDIPILGTMIEVQKPLGMLEETSAQETRAQGTSPQETTPHTQSHELDQNERTKESRAEEQAVAGNAFVPAETAQINGTHANSVPQLDGQLPSPPSFIAQSEPMTIIDLIKEEEETEHLFLGSSPTATEKAIKRSSEQEPATAPLVNSVSKTGIELNNGTRLHSDAQEEKQCQTPKAPARPSSMRSSPVEKPTLEKTLWTRAIESPKVSPGKVNVPFKKNSTLLPLPTKVNPVISPLSPKGYIPREPPRDQLGCWHWNFGKSGCFRNSRECRQVHARMPWVAGKLNGSASTYHPKFAHSNDEKEDDQEKTPIVDQLWGSFPINRANANRVIQTIMANIKHRAPPHEFVTEIDNHGKQANYNLEDNTGLHYRLCGTMGVLDFRGDHVRITIERVLRPFVEANEDKFQDLPRHIFPQNELCIRGAAEGLASHNFRHY